MVFFKHVSSNIFFARMLSCFIAFAVILNIVFSSFAVSNQINFNEVSNIQKDVFSTVFFVSGAVSKIGMDIFAKIIPQQKNKQNDNTKSKQPITNTSNDNILQPNFDRNTKMLSHFNIPWLVYADSAVDLKFYDKHRMCSFVVVYFILMLLFFTSVKNVYDSVNNKIIKIYSAKPALF
ncbi:MAG: hypothetical protein PHR82_04980 [Endomicrobiaceae bacterium]|nr:hypothetical protein [Endomicrobiaceae bacterium]